MRTLGGEGDVSSCSVPEREKVVPACCALLEASPLPMALVDLDLAFSLCNGLLADLLGTALPEELRGTSVLEFIPVEEHRTVAERATQVLAGKTLRDIPYRILRRDGTPLPVKISASAVPDDRGAPRWFLATARDITEERRALQALSESEARYRSLFDTMHNGFVLFDVLHGEEEHFCDFRFLDANPAFERLAGLNLQEIRDTPFAASLQYGIEEGTFSKLCGFSAGEGKDPAKMASLFIEQMKHVVRTGKRLSGETPVLRGGRCFAYTLYRPQAERVALVLEDVTERKHLEESNRRLINRLERDASMDTLTNALNRQRFDKLLAMEMERAHKYGLHLSLVMVDLDNFKTINDSRGHLEGDRILVALSELVQRHIRSCDIFARWGGEEFAILTPVAAGAAQNLAERLRKEVAALNAGGDMAVFASFGIAQYVPGERASEFLNRADQALYAAKRKGKNRVECLFPDER